MTRLLCTISLILFISMPNFIWAQEFQKAFTDFNLVNDFSQDQEGNIYTGGYTTFMLIDSLDKIVSLDIVNKLNNEGEEIWSRNFELVDAFTEIHKVLALPNGDIIALYSIDQIEEELQLGLSRISAQGDMMWSQILEIDQNGFTAFSTEVNLFAADGNNFFVQSKKINSQQHAHFLTKFAASGNTIWSKSYITDLKINNSTIVKIRENQFALIGHFTKSNNNTGGILVLIDADGQISNSSAYDNVEIQGIIPDENDHILKLKHTDAGTAGLMKINNSLDVIWAKDMDFKVEGQIGNLEKFGDNQFVMYMYNNIGRVELLTAYDMEGEVVWSKFIESKYSGRPFTEKIANADGQILMMSNIWSLDLRSSIFRQMPADGNPIECILPIACISDSTINITKTDISFTNGDASASSIPITVSLSNTNKTTSDFCEEVDGVPSPLFDIDESACINTEVLISNTNNAGADDISWSIEGGPEDAILPLANINNGLPISFQDSGLYTITQFIEYRNCFTSYSQDVAITDGLPFSFARDTIIICEGEEQTVNANRPGFLTYLWLDDKSSNPIKKINTPGVYSLELYDGNCTKTVDLVAENFDYGGIEFSLGPDTTVCEFRRFILAADNIREGVEYVWSDGVNTGERYANKEGPYTLTVFLDGCDFSDDINVTFEPCEPQVYVPNIFTPNADGINDTLFPLGKNFELISFRVYNRWGALLHDDITPWDGEFKNEKVTGVYIYNINFFNVRSGDIEQMTGDVYLSK